MPDDRSELTEYDETLQSDATADASPETGSTSRSETRLIKSVQIQNFKGIGRAVQIDLRPITLLFGCNSAGKSTILHALCYAHEILSHRNVDARKTTRGGDELDLGGFQRFVHAHDPNRPVRLRFELNLEGRNLSDQLRTDDLQYLPVEKDDLDLAADSVRSGCVELRIGWNPQLKKPSLQSYAVSVDGDCAGSIRKADASWARFSPNLRHPLFSQVGLSEKNDVSPLGGWHLPQQSVLPAWGETLPIYPESTVTDWEYAEQFVYFASVLMVGVGQLLRNELARFRYIGPMRDVRPPADDESEIESGMPAAVRDALRRPSLPDSTGQAHWSDGSAAWQVLRKSGTDAVSLDLIHDVNDWMSREDRLNTGYCVQQQATVQLPANESNVSSIRNGRPLNDVDIEALARAIARAGTLTTVGLIEVGSELTMRTADVGVGISQILPIVVAALDPARPGITGIEQPELHVHPKIQVELGDLFAQGVDHGGVFLIETHSEHLMLRLLRRIEETHSGELPKGKPALRPEQVSVVFVERVHGELRATPLRIDETGEFIDRWPHGFFDERAEELF